MVIGYWLLVIGYWLLVIGYWLLVIGYWLLVICYWLFVIGYLLFVICYLLSISNASQCPMPNAPFPIPHSPLTMISKETLFALSLFPYLGFLWFLTKSGKTPRLALIGFDGTLVFVAVTIPAGIYAKVAYNESLANIDWLHGAAESGVAESWYETRKNSRLEPKMISGILIRNWNISKFQIMN